VCAVHVAALSGLSMKLQPAPVMIGGAPVIQVTLAPRASFDGANAPRASAASAMPSPKPDENPKPEPAVSDPVPPMLRRPQHAAANVETLTLKDRPTEISRQSRRQSEVGGAALGHASQASEAGLTEGGGAPVIGAAAASTTDAYEAAVLAWIERHKRHPGGATGIVTVRFTLDRRGGVRASEVVASSGTGRVDQAALSQLKDAAPFPRPSPNVSWRTRDFTVRLDFRSLK
jgi:protein TonB